MPEQAIRRVRLLVSIDVDFSELSKKFFWKSLRSSIKSDLNERKGITFKAISTMTHPSPYDFSDPDNMPEGVK